MDGIFSPLFYFLLFGLPGALTYRMINTLDSMVAYKKEPFTELGYASARLDDIANWISFCLSGGKALSSKCKNRLTSLSKRSGLCAPLMMMLSV